MFPTRVWIGRASSLTHLTRNLACLLACLPGIWPAGAGGSIADVVLKQMIEPFRRLYRCVGGGANHLS